MVREQIFGYINDSESIPEPLRFVILFSTSVLFQGMGYMDPTERRFKISFDIAFSLLFFQLSDGTVRSRIISAFCGAHVLNFIVNGQLFVLLKNFDLVDIPKEKFERWMVMLGERYERSQSVDAVVVYGSLSRGDLSRTSDLDVRVLRRDGLVNGLVACSITAVFRFKALIHRFPLDIYVLDGTDSLDRLRDDEEPQVLVDKRGHFE